MINMINKKTTMCLFIILILMMLGVSVVSAEDVTNNATSTEISTNTVTQNEINEINAQKEVTTDNNEITNTIATNKTTKTITKVASQNTKTSEAPSSDGYNLHQISSASEFTRQGAKEYYNLTEDIIFTKTSNGGIFTVTARDDLIINGNGHTISYSGTNDVYFTNLISNVKYTFYNVTFENFTDAALTNLDAGPGNVNITSCVFRNNKNPRTTNENGGGGAIMFAHTSLSPGIVNIQDTKFINNTANRGGAIFYNDPMTMYITNCVFANNSAFGASRVAENGGGAIYAEDGAVVNIVGTSFKNNTFNRSGTIEINNIAVNGASSKVLGYNNDVDGTYITDINSKEFGIYASSQTATAGFHGVVKTTNTYVEFEAINTTLNNTVNYAFRAVEDEYNSSLDGYVLHITFNDTEGNIHEFDKQVNEYGYAYFDYTSEIAGIVSFKVEMDDYYADVLRSEGLVNELIYSHSTSTGSFRFYRINTTTSSSDNTYNGKAYSSKNYTISVVDANGNPVTSGNVSLIDANGVNQTKSVENGEVVFTYNFTHKGSYDLIFNYTGTELVYNSSLVIVHVDISSVDSTLSVDVPEDISVLEPLTVNVSLVNEDGDGIPGQPVKIYVNGEELTGPFTTNASGELQLPITPNNNNDITIRVVYPGTEDINPKEFTKTIPGTSIKLVDTVIGVNLTGNAALGEEYKIRVNLTGNDELIDPSNITVRLGLNSVDASMLNYDTENKLLTITLVPDEVKPYNFMLSYPGLTGVYNPAETVDFTVNVERIPVTVHVDYAEDDPESVILMVRFTDDNNNTVNEGTFRVNMNNSEDERQTYDTQNLDDPNYKWPITVDENGTYYIDVGARFYREDGLPYAYVTYNDNEKYKGGTGRKGEMAVKYDITIDLDTYENKELTTKKDTFYIDDEVYIYLDLINMFGFKQNGDVNITIYNDKYPSQAFKYTSHATHTEGFNFTYHNHTSGEYTILVEYPGSGAYNPSFASIKFTLKKLESTSIVEVKNKTAGNITLGVKVTGIEDEPIRKGKLTVEVDGVPRVVNFNLPNEEDEIIINLNEIGLGIRSTDTVNITVTYQGDDIHASSVAYDQESIESGNPQPLSTLTPDKGTSVISVTVEPENVTIGSQLDVHGTLTDVDGTPITGGNVNITIRDKDGNIVFTENKTTNARGYYSLEEDIVSEI